MANFATALAWTLEFEDPTHEYKIEPDAPPGAFAIAGVNSVENAVAYHLIAASEQNERAPLVANFYHNAFWGWFHENMKSDETRKRFFDAGVNVGSITANKILQKAAGCAQDGVLGAVTLNAVNRAGDTLVLAFQNARADHYKRIVSANPQDAKYLYGWLKRAMK
jgi:lysozyme family protein